MAFNKKTPPAKPAAKTNTDGKPNLPDEVFGFRNFLSSHVLYLPFSAKISKDFDDEGKYPLATLMLYPLTKGVTTKEAILGKLEQIFGTEDTDTFDKMLGSFISFTKTTKNDQTKAYNQAFIKLIEG